MENKLHVLLRVYYKRRPEHELARGGARQSPSHSITREKMGLRNRPGVFQFGHS